MSRTWSRKSLPKIVAVTGQVTRELVKGECFPQLLSRPRSGRMSGHIEVDDTTSIMGQNQKHVKDLETKSGHGKDRARQNLEEGESKVRR